MVETEDALRVEVSEVCRYYCLQVWNGVLNQAGVEASSALKRVESVYYPPAIWASSSSIPKADAASKEADASKDSLDKVLPSSGSPSKEAEQPEATGKTTDTTKEVAHDITQPPTAPKGPTKEKEASQAMELVLATLLMPTKEDLNGKGPTSSTTAFDQPPKTSTKDKFVIKLK